MQYVDSNIFLYPVLYQPEVEPKAKTAKIALQKIESGEQPAATSILTWDEVVWVTSKHLGRSEGIIMGQKLLGFPNLEFIDVDQGIVARAQALMSCYALSPRDSIHIASALSKKAKVILSDDEDLDQVKEIKRKPLK